MSVCTTGRGQLPAPTQPPASSRAGRASHAPSYTRQEPRYSTRPNPPRQQFSPAPFSPRRLQIPPRSTLSKSRIRRRRREKAPGTAAEVFVNSRTGAYRQAASPWQRRQAPFGTPARGQFRVVPQWATRELVDVGRLLLSRTNQGSEETGGATLKSRLSTNRSA